MSKKKGKSVSSSHNTELDTALQYLEPHSRTGNEALVPLRAGLLRDALRTIRALFAAQEAELALRSGEASAFAAEATRLRYEAKGTEAALDRYARRVAELEAQLAQFDDGQ